LTGDPDSKIFSVCQLENTDYLNEIGTKIAEHLAKDTTNTPYKPKKEEMVLANFDGTFYRAVCKEKSTEGYLVSYIDYGNSAVVKEQDIRVFDKKLLFDVVIHSVFLENFPDEIDEKTAAILEQEGVPMEGARKLKDGYAATISGL
jgi:Tudor domain